MTTENTTIWALEDPSARLSHLRALQDPVTRLFHLHTRQAELMTELVECNTVIDATIAELLGS